jgi:hypothetical protein
MKAPELVEPLQKGLLKSLRMLWLLAKIIIPVSCLIVFLEHYGIIEKISAFFAPAMSLTGLPGEASIALTLGALVNLYAALGVLAVLPLSAQQATVIALMLGICHELPVETVISAHTGLKIPVSAALRLAAALAAGAALHFIFSLFH